MKEKIIETQIIAFLRYQGAWVTKIQAGGMAKAYTNRKTGEITVHRIHLAQRGVPDLLTCIAGKFIAIEVKKDAKEIEKWEKAKDTDTRSAAQHAQQGLIREAGGVTLIVCSVEEVETDLRELGLIQ